jgi:hypothetical protein
MINLHIMKKKLIQTARWFNENQGVMAFIAIIVSIAVVALDWKWGLAIASILLIIFISARQAPVKPAPLKSNIKNPVNKENSKKIEKVDNNPKTNPRAIIDQVDSQPPYLHKKTEESYTGLKVRWKLEFHKILKEYEDGCVDLMLRWEEGFPWVYLTAHIGENPELKVIRSKTEITIIGTIEKVNGHDISIKGTKIQF